MAASPALLRPLAQPGRSLLRTYATSIPAKVHHRVVIVGAGTAGVTAAAQLQHAPGLENKDIAILDPAQTHHYQVSSCPIIHSLSGDEIDSC